MDSIPEVKKEEAKQEMEDVNEECKMVLVVRTDLGMTKGVLLHPCYDYEEVLIWRRQDCSPSEISVCISANFFCTS